MRGFKLALPLPRFMIAAWVMTSVVVAIAYGLCLGTAEAVTPHGTDTHRA
ncbi:hypothetical protein [Dongia sedimenti]|uniref:Uncharacterized protein n=1 Tax=Dongia sedimenti TaxID=3064282 RepID=A0ABU0YLP4_9PROT|nr:hypothetical protein [Rhodospirillaceae bacterium R-7]